MSPGPRATPPNPPRGEGGNVTAPTRSRRCVQPAIGGIHGQRTAATSPPWKHAEGRSAAEGEGCDLPPPRRGRGGRLGGTPPGQAGGVPGGGNPTRYSAPDGLDGTWRDATKWSGRGAGIRAPLDTGGVGERPAGAWKKSTHRRANRLRSGGSGWVIHPAIGWPRRLGGGTLGSIRRGGDKSEERGVTTGEARANGPPAGNRRGHRQETGREGEVEELGAPIHRGAGGGAEHCAGRDQSGNGSPVQVRS